MIDDTLPEPAGTWITNVVVLDPDRGSPGSMDVLLRADRIAEITPHEGSETVRPESRDQDEAAEDARYRNARHVDGSGCLLIPGLIDCHAHVAFPPVESLPHSARILEAAHTLHRLASRGITTVRDAWGADTGFVHALREGWVGGPDLLVTLMQLAPIGGLSDPWRPDIGRVDRLGDPALPDPQFDGPDAARAAVRRMVRAGADWIKVGASGSLNDTRRGRTVRPIDAELTAIVDEAQRCERDVMAHAHTTESTVAATRAGVRSIEHGVFLNDSAIEALATHGCWYVPTLAPVAENGRPEEIAAHRRTVRRAADAGVRLAAGSDMARRPHVDLLTELRLLAEVLDDDRAALRAATSNAARLLRLEQDRGRIAPGFRADLVLVDDTHLDIARLADRIRLVWRNGQEVPGQFADRLGRRSTPSIS